MEEKEFSFKGRSTYTLQFNCARNTIEQLMQNFISAKGFILIEKKGEKYFRAEEMGSYKALTYSILNQTITINAWLDGALGDFPLEPTYFNTVYYMMATNFKTELSTLFQEIEKLNGGNTMNNKIDQKNNGVNFEAQTGQKTNNQQITKTINNEIQKKKETMCNIGFWLSIIGLFCSFVGVGMSLFIYIFDFYCASQGLKTKKRGKAITTIILSIISIIILVYILIIKLHEIWK